MRKGVRKLSSNYIDTEHFYKSLIKTLYRGVFVEKKMFRAEVGTSIFSLIFKKISLLNEKVL